MITFKGVFEDEWRGALASESKSCQIILGCFPFEEQKVKTEGLAKYVPLNAKKYIKTVDIFQYM